jgi:hypothetical protein
VLLPGLQIFLGRIPEKIAHEEKENEYGDDHQTGIGDKLEIQSEESGLHSFCE